MERNAHTDFIETLGLILQTEGFPRIAGRLLGVFVLNGGPLSFQDLCDALQISRGSVSTNTRLLENLGAVERVAVLGERQDYFRLAENPYERIAARKVERAREASERLRRGRDALPNCDPETFKRATELAGFFGSISHACALALEDMRASRNGPEAPHALAGE